MIVLVTLARDMEIEVPDGEEDTSIIEQTAFEQFAEDTHPLDNMYLLSWDLIE